MPEQINILQITPALPGWVGRFTDDSSSDSDEILIPVACWALVEGIIRDERCQWVDGVDMDTSSGYKDTHQLMSLIGNFVRFDRIES